jgi:hypothetical protein
MPNVNNFPRANQNWASNVNMNANANVNGMNGVNNKMNVQCHKCGRRGYYARECVARRTIDGKKLG